MTGTEQPAQILLPTNKIGRSVIIMNMPRTDTSNRMDPTNQQTIIHFKQVNGLGHSDCNHFPIGILEKFIDVYRSWRNIDKCTRMNLQGPILTTILFSIRTNKCEIFSWLERRLIFRTWDRCGMEQ